MKMPMTPELEALLKEQRKAFKKKFGRYPKPGEPVFFDPDADTPQPMNPNTIEADTLAVMRSAGTPAEVIYAYKKTGRILQDDYRDRYPREAIEEWDAAIREYRRLEKERASISDLPKRKLGDRERKVPQTEIPELLASPYTNEDKAAIFKCLDALDVVLAVTPMTVRARLEVAAVLIAMAADAAYESVIDQGGAVEEALERAVLFGSMALDRAEEIFDTIRRDE